MYRPDRIDLAIVWLNGQFAQMTTRTDPSSSTEIVVPLMVQLNNRPANANPELFRPEMKPFGWARVVIDWHQLDVEPYFLATVTHLVILHPSDDTYSMLNNHAYKIAQHRGTRLPVQFERVSRELELDWQQRELRQVIDL